jgi:hypothetical protein
MKKPTITQSECVRRLQAVADDLASEGVDNFSIMNALLHVTVATGRKNSPPYEMAASLDVAANVLRMEAEVAFKDAFMPLVTRRALGQKRNAAANPRGKLPRKRTK